MSQASLEVVQLSPIHKHMCALAAAGLGTSEIAEATNYSVSRVSIVLNHPDAQVMIARLSTDLATRITDDVAMQIKASTGEAFQKVLGLMREAKSETVQKECAFDLLNRGGFKPREVHVNASVELPREEAALLRETLNELGTEIPYRPPVNNAVELLTRGSETTIESKEEDAKGSSD